MSYELRLLQNVPPSVLEEIVAELLRRMGFKDIRVVGGPSDKGVDIEAFKVNEFGFREKYVVQVKRYSSSRKAGHTDLQHFIIALKAARADKGIFVTTSDFTRSAVEFIESNYEFKSKVFLVNGFKLLDLIKQYGVPIPTAVPETFLKPPLKVKMKKVHEVLRVFELDYPIALRYDYDDVVDKLSGVLRVKYGVKDFSVERATLEYVPLHIVEWKAYYEGYDSMGRLRQRTASGKALVLHDGGIIADIGRESRLWIASEVRKRARLRYGRVKASKLIKGKGISLTSAKRIVKSKIASKYDCSTRDISIISWRNMYLGLKWIIDFTLMYNSGRFEADMVKNKFKLDFEPLDEEILKDIISKAVEEKVNENVVNLEPVSRKNYELIFEGETSSFTIKSIVNRYSGKVLEINTRFKKEAAISLAKALVAEGSIIGVEEKEEEIIIDVEDESSLYLITIDAQTGKYNMEKDLINHTKAFAIAEEFLRNRYGLQGLKILDYKLINHRVWEFNTTSPDGSSIVNIDVRTGNIVKHEIVFSEKKVKEIFFKKYPGKTIASLTFDKESRTYGLKAFDKDYIYEYKVDASTLDYKLENMYLKEEIVDNIAINAVKQIKDKPLNIADRKLAESIWIIKVETPLWYRTYHIDKIKGNIVKREDLLKTKGAEEFFKQYIIGKYRVSVLETVQVKHSSLKPKAYVVKLKDLEENYYYAFIDKHAGKVIEHDVLRKSKGIMGWMKAKMYKTKLELKYR